VETQHTMKRKYSLSKNEILIQEQGSIREICTNVLANNTDLHLLDDLVQDISLILLTQMEETIQSLYETNQFRFFVARIVTNQVLSNTSPFHTTYRLREPKNDFIQEDYDFRPDEMWYKALNLPNDMAKTVIYLRFEYGLKIREIAVLKGVSPRYVHKVLLKAYEYLEKDL